MIILIDTNKVHHAYTYAYICDRYKHINRYHVHTYIQTEILIDYVIKLYISCMSFKRKKMLELFCMSIS